MRYKPWGLMFCWLGLVAGSAQASDSQSGNLASKVALPNQQEVPEEEFWLFMAEFSENDELIDPGDLAILPVDKSPKLATSKQSAVQDISSAGDSEESL